MPACSPHLAEAPRAATACPSLLSLSLAALQQCAYHRRWSQPSPSNQPSFQSIPKQNSSSIPSCHTFSLTLSKHYPRLQSKVVPRLATPVLQLCNSDMKNIRGFHKIITDQIREYR